MTLSEVEARRGERRRETDRRFRRYTLLWHCRFYGALAVLALPCLCLGLQSACLVLRGDLLGLAPWAGSVIWFAAFRNWPLEVNDREYARVSRLTREDLAESERLLAEDLNAAREGLEQ